MSFETDLQVGKEGEDLLAKYLVSNAITPLHNISFNNDARFDILGYDDFNRPYTFEVKYDQYKATGNMAVELFCRNREKPTGLFATEADFFVYIFKMGPAYMARTSIWKTIVKELPQGSIRAGGDKGHAILCLIPIEDYKDKLKEINL